MYIVNYTSDEFKKLSEKVDTVILPIGSVEAHGHHLPLGTDIFSPRLFCEKIEQKIKEDVWIAPEIPYGQSYDLSIYPGTVHVPSEVLAEYIFCIGKSFFENGLKKIIFLNGHGGNITGLGLASEKLAQLGADILILNWWLDFSKEILTITSAQGHGGEDETSAILYYDETLVKKHETMKNTNKPLIPVRFKDRGKVVFKDALTGDATTATKEKGEKIFNLLTDKIIEAIRIVKSGVYYTEEK